MHIYGRKGGPSPEPTVLRRFMGPKHGVDEKELGLASCSKCGAVIDPSPWQVPVQGESSLLVFSCFLKG
jgi:hypothetical protein